MTYEEVVEKAKRHVQKRAPKAFLDHVAVQFNVRHERPFYLELNQGKVNIQADEYYDHDVMIAATAEQIDDILTGRLDAMEAIEDGRIRAEGNIRRLEILNNILFRNQQGA
ncbi:MAG: SCP2 sterol-binding domain-containing protein [Lachnospiraceae bacterium]|nr:SCP2 sterol-binding domain-containing protein [Lachnospiraceae bacterium]